MYLYFKYTRKDQYLYLYLYFTGRKVFVSVFQILMYVFDPKSGLALTVYMYFAEILEHKNYLNLCSKVIWESFQLYM